MPLHIHPVPLSPYQSSLSAALGPMILSALPDLTFHLSHSSSRQIRTPGVHNEQLLEVKCTSDAGCAPVDASFCSGITARNISGVTPVMPYLITATGFSHGSKGALACLSLRLLPGAPTPRSPLTPQTQLRAASPPGACTVVMSLPRTGRGEGGSKRTLVGGCQVSLPMEEGVGERVEGGFVSGGPRSSYEVGAEAVG